MHRYIGLDYGEKRIGVAVSDPLGMTAQPKPYILNDKQVFEQIKEVVSSFNDYSFVVGLPKNREGGDSKKAEYVREFAKELETFFSKPIEFADERYSTVAVTRTLIDADLSRRKRKQVVDSASAVFVLQGFLDRKSNQRLKK